MRKIAGKIKDIIISLVKIKAGKSEKESLKCNKEEALKWAMKHVDKSDYVRQSFIQATIKAFETAEREEKQKEDALECPVSDLILNLKVICPKIDCVKHPFRKQHQAEN